jgi:hypothetical protein
MVLFMFTALRTSNNNNKKWVMKVWKLSGAAQSPSIRKGLNVTAVKLRRNNQYIILLSKKQSYPCNRPWKPIVFLDIEVPTFSRQSAHMWRWGQPYAPAAPYFPRIFLVLISVRSWVDPYCSGKHQVNWKIQWPYRESTPATFENSFVLL